MGMTTMHHTDCPSVAPTISENTTTFVDRTRSRVIPKPSITDHCSSRGRLTLTHLYKPFSGWPARRVSVAHDTTGRLCQYEGEMWKASFRKCESTSVSSRYSFARRGRTSCLLVYGQNSGAHVWGRGLSSRTLLVSRKQSHGLVC